MPSPLPKTALEVLARPDLIRDRYKFATALRNLRVLLPGVREVTLHYQPGARNCALDLRTIAATGAAPATEIPDQTGYAGAILYTDGAAPYWGFDPEVETWRARALAAGGTFTAASVSLARDLISGLQAATYNSKIIALWPFLGGNLATARVPLRDTLGVGIATNHAFLEADFTEATGLKGNGSTKYLDTLIKPGQLGTGGNGGVGWWQRAVSAASGTQYGPGMVYNATAPGETFGLRFGNSPADIDCEFYWGANGNQATIAELRSNAHYYGQRSSTTDRRLFKNGAQVAQNTTADTVIRTSYDTLTLFAVNFDHTPLAFNAGACSVAYLTDGTLTPTEAADLHTLLQTTLIGPLGR